jgi:hypothetical protein
MAVDTKLNRPWAVLYFAKRALLPITAGAPPPPPVAPWQPAHRLAKTFFPCSAYCPKVRPPVGVGVGVAVGVGVGVGDGVGVGPGAGVGVGVGDGVGVGLGAGVGVGVSDGVGVGLSVAVGVGVGVFVPQAENAIIATRIIVKVIKK